MTATTQDPDFFAKSSKYRTARLKATGEYVGIIAVCRDFDTEEVKYFVIRQCTGNAVQRWKGIAASPDELMDYGL